MVVAVAGNVDHADVVRLVRTAFGRNGFLDRRPSRPAAPAHGGRGRGARRRRLARPRPFEQVNLVLGMQGLTRTDDAPLRARRAQHRARRRHVVAAVPGGPREARPGLLRLLLRLATTPTPAWSASRSAACRPSSTRCSPSVRDELAKVAADGITDEELVRGKGQLRGGLVLGLEDSGSRMSRLGKAELVYDELLGIDEVLARIDAVTLDDVRAVARELFTQPEILAVVGP